MSYLERNSKLVTEVGATVKLQRGASCGESRSVRFSSAGSFISEEVGEEVFVGLKELKENRNPEFLRQRFVFELAVMSVVAQNMPHLLPELPLFYGLLLDSEGNPMAIITEDFTRNGQNSVSTYAAEPRGLRDLFVEGTVEDDFICNVGFMVFPKIEEEYNSEDELPPIGTRTNQSVRRLGDFYPLVPFNKRGIHRAHFPEEQIEGELDRHSLKIDYDLEAK